jgi:hypothetical protein
MRDRFSFTIGWLGLHANAFSNSGRFTTMPLTRYLPGECGSVMAFTRRWRVLDGLCALFNAQSLDGVDGCGAASGDHTCNTSGDNQNDDGYRHDA